MRLENNSASAPIEIRAARTIGRAIGTIQYELDRLGTSLNKGLNAITPSIHKYIYNFRLF